jgi:hypothetical protein
MENGQFGAKKLTLHDVELWWIVRKVEGRLVLYSDVHSPFGYGFKSRARALVEAQKIEDRLNGKEESK